MKRPMPALLLSVFLLFCVGAPAQVEQVLSYVVSDETTMVEALDAWYATRDSRFGQTATLMATVANGTDPTTHYLVINYPDYASYQAAQEGVVKSAEFSRLERRASMIASQRGDALYAQLLSNGKTEKAGDYSYTVSVNVTGPQREYVAASGELMRSGIGKRCPGAMKFLAGRAGTDSSHLTVISAPSLAALVSYLDAYENDQDWAGFLTKVEKFTTPAGTGLLRVVKVWK